MARASFHSVSIVAKVGTPCPAAELIQGVRYLSNSAPEVPLAGCDRRGGCRCIYKHYEDRRQDTRRDADVGLPGQPYFDSERREAAGRRAIDAPKASRQR